MLDGRTAIVTGAGRGIGAAIARALDAAGARVALVARSADQLEETAATLANQPVVVPADLATPDGPGSAVAAALEAFGGRIDVLVNNAGIIMRKDTEALTIEDLDNVWNANVRSVLLASAAVIPPMLAAGSGSIISISSISGLRGAPAACFVRREQGRPRRDDARRWRWSTAREASAPTASRPASSRRTCGARTSPTRRRRRSSRSDPDPPVVDGGGSRRHRRLPRLRCVSGDHRRGDRRRRRHALDAQPLADRMTEGLDAELAAARQRYVDAHPCSRQAGRACRQGASRRKHALRVAHRAVRLPCGRRRRRDPSRRRRASLRRPPR